MPNQARTWVLIADAARAKVIEATGDFSYIQTVSDLVFENPLRGSTSSEGDGGDARSATEAHHNGDTRTVPHRGRQKQFASELVNVLERSFARRRFDRLILVAPPVFLGELRAQLTAALRPAVVADLNKDLSKLPDLELAKYLREVEKG